jgi:hypothetical protein
MGRLQNNPSIGCMHPKSTDARLLAWGNKNLKDLEKKFTGPCDVCAGGCKYIVREI